MKRVLARLRHGLKDESGQALMLCIVGLMTVLAFAGLAIDVGQLQLEKHQMQAAADAAALAGALEISQCGGTADCSAMTTAAQKAVSENGFGSPNLLTQCASNGNTTLTLILNNGPCFLGSTSADPNYGNTDYVEAVVTQPINTPFAALAGFKKFNITVRAEAHTTASSNCLIVGANDTGATSGDGLDLDGGTIDASSCDVYDDWGGADSLDEANSSSTVTSSGFYVHGPNCNTGSGPCNGGNFGSNSPQWNAAAISDPLAGLTAPTPGSCTSQNSTPSNGASLSPGTFCSGLNFNPGTYTMTAGLYIIEGGMNISGTVNATAGVTIYMYSGQLNLNSGSDLELTAPSSNSGGAFQGIAYWQSSSDNDEINFDQPTSITGAIYAPAALLQMNSNSSVTGCTLVDVGSVTVDASSTLNLGVDCSSVGGSPFSGGSVNLAE